MIGITRPGSCRCLTQDGLSVAPAIRAYGGNQARSPAEMALAAARVDGRVTVLDFVTGTNGMNGTMGCWDDG